MALQILGNGPSAPRTALRNKKRQRRRVRDHRIRRFSGRCLMDRGSFTTLSSVLALVILAPLTAAGQDSGWKVPRTSWGDPDLMGTFTNRTFTPVQRPAE